MLIDFETVANRNGYKTHLTLFQYYLFLVEKKNLLKLKIGIIPVYFVSFFVFPFIIEKNSLKFAIFRLTRRSWLSRRPGWTDNLLIFFLSGLQKLDFGRCSMFLPDRAKNLSALRYNFRLQYTLSHPLLIPVIRKFCSPLAMEP